MLCIDSVAKENFLFLAPVGVLWNLEAGGRFGVLTRQSTELFCRRVSKPCVFPISRWIKLYCVFNKFRYYFGTCKFSVTFIVSSVTFQKHSHKRIDDMENSNGAPDSKVVGVPTHEGQYVKYTVAGTDFEVPMRYKPPIRPIGRGAYGIVCALKDSLTKEEVAVKKIGNAFDNRIDAKRTLREIKLLRHMEHENVITITDIIQPPTREDFNDVYIVYELMDTDLHQIIRSNQMLTEDHCQYFLYQLLRGLKYIHSANVLHRDLKPTNLLLNANCDLKIADFGLARTLSESDFMTEYVVTRWYRAPELLLNCSAYTAAIDIWSVGCIFMELLNRTPLFPGRDYVHQLRLITELIGTPEDKDLGFLRNDNARRYIKQLPRQSGVPLTQKFKGINRAALDLVDKMLIFDPAKRITVEDALAHPFLASLHDINDEPACASPFEFDFEEPSISEENIKDLIWKEALLCSSNSDAMTE